MRRTVTAPACGLLWSPTTSGNYLFDTAGSHIESVMAVYTGNNMHTLVEVGSVAGNQSTGLINQSNYSSLRVNLVQGERYYIALAGKAEAEGNLVLNYRPFSLNDQFAAALAIPSAIPAEGTRLTVDISEAQLESSEPDYADALASDYLPATLLARFTDVAAGGNAGENTDGQVAVPDDADLLSMLQGLYDSSLQDLQNRPFDHSLWFSYTASEDGDLVLSSQGSEPDTALFIYTGDSLANLQAKAWSDDVDNGLHAQLRYAMHAGERYMISLAARGEGVISLNAEFVPLAAQSVDNDTPETAILVVREAGIQRGTGFSAADNSYARHSNLVKQISAQDDRRLWWRFDADQSGYLIIDTQGSEVDTLLEAYARNALNDMTLLTLNDNYHPDLNSSRLALAVTADTSYWISVDSLNGSGGTLRLNYRYADSVPMPVNDAFSTPVMIGADNHSGRYHSDHAYYQSKERSIGSHLKPNSVWFRWTPLSAGEVSLNTLGSDFDTLLGLYSGSSLSSLTLLESNDNIDADDDSSALTANVSAGTGYYIAVAGKRDVQGAFNLNIDVSPIDDSGLNQD